MTTERDIVHETAQHWVKRVKTGFTVYRHGVTHATRVAVIGYRGHVGLARAIAEVNRREGT